VTNCQLGVGLCEGKERGRRRALWAYIGGFFRAEGARVRSGRGDGRRRCVGLGRVSGQRRKRGLTGGLGVSVRRERRARYRFGILVRWAVG
jgi:hypothetical protein